MPCKNTNTKVERANSVISDTLCAYANRHKDDWDRQLPLAVFTINNTALTLGDRLTPFFIDRCEHPRRLPLTARPLLQAAPAASRRHTTRGGWATWS